MILVMLQNTGGILQTQLIHFFAIYYPFQLLQVTKTAQFLIQFARLKISNVRNHSQ